MLRRRIDACKGLVQLVGECYGAEPPAADDQFGRLSYTQYEALYASSRGKRVWYLFLDESFPFDSHDPEDPEKKELQRTYRDRLKADAHLYHSLGTREGLENSVLKLRDDLTRLRRGVKRWAMSVAILLLVSVGLSLWLLQSQHQANQQQQEYRSVLTLREKVLGVEHPDTLETCFNLATCLRAEGKASEAKTFAQRAADGARRSLGPEHPDTKKYEQLRDELAAKQD
jgi:Tetratricopeptide repeat